MSSSFSFFLSFWFCSQFILLPFRFWSLSACSHVCICFLFSVFFFSHVLSLLLYICFLSIFFFSFSSDFLFLFWFLFLFILSFSLCLLFCVDLYFLEECCWFVFSICVFCSNMFAHSDAFCSLLSSSSHYLSYPPSSSPSSSSCLSCSSSLCWIAFLLLPACRDDSADQLPARTSNKEGQDPRSYDQISARGQGGALTLVTPAPAFSSSQN